MKKIHIVFCGLIAFYFTFLPYLNTPQTTPPHSLVACYIGGITAGLLTLTLSIGWQDVLFIDILVWPPPPFPANGVHIHLWGEGPGIVNVDNGSHVPCPTMTHLNNLANVITWWWHDNVVVSFLLFCVASAIRKKMCVRVCAVFFF